MRLFCAFSILIARQMVLYVDFWRWIGPIAQIRFVLSMNRIRT